MRKLWLVLPSLLGILLGTVAVAATGISLNTATRFEFTDCSSGGSSAQTITKGSYLLRVTDSDLFMCTATSASTCATLGEKFPSGTVMLIYFDSSTSVSCRSAASTGDLILTRGG